MIGEMRREKGQVRVFNEIDNEVLVLTCRKVAFGGDVAYVPQTPWIRNATIRENIIFGQEDDDERCV